MTTIDLLLSQTVAAAIAAIVTGSYVRTRMHTAHLNNMDALQKLWKAMYLRTDARRMNALLGAVESTPDEDKLAVSRFLQRYVITTSFIVDLDLTDTSSDAQAPHNPT